MKFFSPEIFFIQIWGWSKSPIRRKVDDHLSTKFQISLLKVRILITDGDTCYISRSASDEKSTRNLKILITEEFHYFHMLPSLQPGFDQLNYYSEVAVFTIRLGIENTIDMEN